MFNSPLRPDETQAHKMHPEEFWRTFDAWVTSHRNAFGNIGWCHTDIWLFSSGRLK